VRSRRLAGAASTLLLLILLRAAGAEMPPPGTVITAENLERYREALFPTAEYFLRHGMTITVIPYRRWQWTALYKEATEKFASQVRLSADGRDLQNYVAGAPFPTIDTPNDPLAAYKWIWNHEQNPAYTDNIGMGWSLELVNSSGARERFMSSNFWRRMRWRGRLVIDPKPVVPHEPAVSYTEQWGPLDEPSDLKGAGVLNFRYVSPDAPDDTYMYLPSLRKVRRLSVANRSDSFWGLDIDMDSIWSFNAKIQYWTFKVLGEKQLLHPLHAGGYGRRDAWCAQPDGASGIKAFAFCLPWELRPMVVIEATPTGYSQYAYGKRIVYIDKEWLSTSFSEGYDHGGQLWKAWYMAIDTGKAPAGDEIPDRPAWSEERMVATHGGMVDFQLNHVSKWDAPDAYLFPNFGVKHWYVDQPREWNTPENFTINFLINSGGM
jgi:uncharacterized protein DUF1329